MIYFILAGVVAIVGATYLYVADFKEYENLGRRAKTLYG